MIDPKEAKCALCGETYYGFTVEPLPKSTNTCLGVEEWNKITRQWERHEVTVVQPARKGYKVTPLQQLVGHWRERHPNVSWDKVRGLSR